MRRYEIGKKAECDGTPQTAGEWSAEDMRKDDCDSGRGAGRLQRKLRQNPQTSKGERNEGRHLQYSRGDVRNNGPEMLR